MLMLSAVLALGLAGAAAAATPEGPQIIFPEGHGCGEVNVFYTGLPAYHPLVAAQGWDPVMVDTALRNDTVTLVKAGYNVRIVWAGPEIPHEELRNRLDEQTWDVTGIGFGQRGAQIPEIITLFEDNLHAFREKVPTAPTVFNYNPNTITWSVARRAPLVEDCTDKPGKFYGYEEICELGYCEKVTVEYDIDELI